MRLINLLPKENQKAFRLEQAADVMLEFWTWTIVSLLVLTTAIVVATFYLGNQIQTIENSIAERQDVLNSSDYKALQTQIQEINSHSKEVKSIKEQHLYWSKALIALAQIIPPDVQLSQVTISRDTGKIDIAGQAQRRDSVILIWSNVLKSQMFRDINFPLPNLEKANFPNFTFSFYVNKDQLSEP